MKVTNNQLTFVKVDAQYNVADYMDTDFTGVPVGEYDRSTDSLLDEISEAIIDQISN